MRRDGGENHKGGGRKRHDTGTNIGGRRIRFFLAPRTPAPRSAAHRAGIAGGKPGASHRDVDEPGTVLALPVGPEGLRDVPAADRSRGHQAHARAETTPRKPARPAAPKEGPWNRQDLGPAAAECRPGIVRGLAPPGVAERPADSSHGDQHGSAVSRDRRAAPDSLESSQQHLFDGRHYRRRFGGRPPAATLRFRSKHTLQPF
mmetsp:Transcript_2321/g.5154  ORF Transcript_2321/g.5154 Transcript_2321/m.5154 type:complete len:203 (+) Transcript_2321:389-997(+)